jgi:hypothetical protein
VCRRFSSAPFAQSAETERQKTVTFSILEDYDKGDDLSDVAKDFQLFRELGITTWRGSFGWDDYEPTRGHYDFAWLNRFADLAASYGITLRPYVAYTPAWAAAGGADKDVWNDPPRSIDDWGRFVSALATAMRHHRNIASYEIYNEEDVAQWWDGSPAAYNRVLARASAAIRTISPHTQVLLGGMVYADAGWLHEVCGTGHNGPRFDVLPFHAYPETWTPPEVTLERYLGPHFEDGFVRAADRACGSKPIWINETGFATTEGRTERDQAEWWTRAIATFVAEPRVEHIGVYEIKDLKPDREAIGGVPNYHLGITRADRTKKMAFDTIRDLVRLIRGPLVNEDAQLQVSATGGDTTAVYRHAFKRRDGHHVLMLWTTSDERTVDVRVPQEGAAAIEHQIDGISTPYERFDGRRLSGVTLRRGDPKVFEIVPR